MCALRRKGEKNRHGSAGILPAKDTGDGASVEPKPDEPEPKRERIKSLAWARVVYERAMPAIRPVPANTV